MVNLKNANIAINALQAGISEKSRSNTVYKIPDDVRSSTNLKSDMGSESFDPNKVFKENEMLRKII